MIILVTLYLLRPFNLYLIIFKNMKLTFYFHFNKLIQKYFIKIRILALIITNYNKKISKMKKYVILTF